MPETLVVLDVSEFQKPLTSIYARPAVIIRAVFGTGKRDEHLTASTAAAAELWKAKKLRGGVVLYQVPVPAHGSAQEHFNFFWEQLGHVVPE